MRAVRKLVTGYNHMLNHHPRVLVATQSGLLMAAGDFLAQTCVERVPLKDVEPSRIVRFGLIGACLAGPGLKAWFWSLDRVFGRKMNFRNAVIKTFVDQGILAPPMLALVVGTVQYAKHQDLEKTVEFCKHHGFEILKTNWLLWPTVQMVNFYYVSLEYRLLVAQCVALFWNIYLANKANKNDEDVDWESQMGSHWPKNSPAPPSQPSDPCAGPGDTPTTPTPGTSPPSASCITPMISFAPRDSDNLDDCAINSEADEEQQRPHLSSTPPLSRYVGVSRLYSEFSQS